MFLRKFCLTGYTAKTAFIYTTEADFCRCRCIVGVARCGYDIKAKAKGIRKESDKKKICWIGNAKRAHQVNLIIEIEYNSDN